MAVAIFDTEQNNRVTWILYGEVHTGTVIDIDKEELPICLVRDDRDGSEVWYVAESLSPIGEQEV